LEITIPIEDPSRRSALYGSSDRNLRLIRTAFDVRITARDNLVKISGNNEGVARAAQVLEDLQQSLRHRPVVTDAMVQEAIEHAVTNGNGKARAPGWLSRGFDRIPTDRGAKGVRTGHSGE